jgi:HSP20 family molecular chaperone IbpA
MSEVKLNKVVRADDRTLPVFAEVDRLRLEISRRAHELFETRGLGNGHELDDWLEAERELCWPPAEFAEGESEFVLSVGLPGFEPGEIEATVTPREAIVHAHHGTGRKGKKRGTATPSWSELRSDDLYRRIELPDAIDVANARAALRHGMLRIIVPKLGAVQPVIHVASAA